MAVIPPWQQAADDSAPAVAAPRTPTGQFVPGRSGNPSGRPPGIVDKRNRVAKAFDHEFDSIGEAIVKRAKQGDMSAAALYLSRVEPPLRPKAERTPFALDTTKPSAEQAAQVLAAVAAGDLDHDAGKALIDAIAGIAQLKRFDQFEAELALLRQQMQRIGAATGTGGQVHFDMKDAAAACDRPTLPKPTEAQ